MFLVSPVESADNQPGPTAEDKEAEPRATLVLDKLFRKTKATPSIYWLPLSEEKVCSQSCPLSFSHFESSLCDCDAPVNFHRLKKRMTSVKLMKKTENVVRKKGLKSARRKGNENVRGKGNENERGKELSGKSVNAREGSERRESGGQGIGIDEGHDLALALDPGPPDEEGDDDISFSLSHSKHSNTDTHTHTHICILN